jgi:hypothetical protein
MEFGQDTLQEARALAGEIARLARAHDNKSLLQLSAEPATEQLLGVLPDRESQPARVHLNSAAIWRAKLNRKALGKLEAANKALAELDLVLAKGILRKIDAEILDEAALAEYDQLLLSVEARAMELDEIESVLPQLPEEEQRRKRFWNR